MTNYFNIVFLLFFGLLFAPKQGLACHSMPDESTEQCQNLDAKTVDEKKSCDMDCCKKTDGSETTTEQKHDCDGSCQGNCYQVVTHFYFALPASINITTSGIGFFLHRDNFQSTKTHTSSGFYSIWSPPNINS